MVQISKFFNVEHGHGSRKKLYMFMGVALLILILACLNYLNLISAYAIKRENETWIRKVHGASTGNITNYLMIESMMLSFVAWGLAALLSLLGLRLFENMLGVVIDPVLFLFMHRIWFDHRNYHCGSGLGILSRFKSWLWCIDSFKRS